jgi:hypothetical protein
MHPRSTTGPPLDCLTELEAPWATREHAIRAMDAWHLAVAVLTLPSLVEPGEDVGFATRDQAQSDVAASLGLRVV